jgi:hypothetical protein
MAEGNLIFFFRKLRSQQGRIELSGLLLLLDCAMKLAADKDAIGTPLPPPPLPLSEFIVLQDKPAGQLLAVAAESGILLDPLGGKPLEVISMLQAKELVQAKLARTMVRLEQEKKLAKEKENLEAGASMADMAVASKAS